jgi:uncharacterized membrane protein YeaQ/YmgE (transglycosylase-associated protein family)
MKWLCGFLLLLAIAILITYIGKKLLPVMMPSSRTKAIFVGLIGGLVGSLIFQFCHLVSRATLTKVNLIGAFLGATIFIILLELYPFIKLLY